MSALAVCLTACSKDKTTEGAEASDNTSVEAEEEDTFSASTGVQGPVSFADLTSTVVNLGEYKGIEAVRIVEEVTDEDVESEVRAIREDYGELVDVNRPAQMGDVVTIDYIDYVDGETSDILQGEEYQLELGYGGFPRAHGTGASGSCVRRADGSHRRRMPGQNRGIGGRIRLQ